MIYKTKKYIFQFQLSFDREIVFIFKMTIKHEL